MYVGKFNNVRDAKVSEIKDDFIQDPKLFWHLVIVNGIYWNLFSTKSGGGSGPSRPVNYHLSGGARIVEDRCLEFNGGGTLFVLVLARRLTRSR